MSWAHLFIANGEQSVAQLPLIAGEMNEQRLLQFERSSRKREGDNGVGATKDEPFTMREALLLQQKYPSHQIPASSFFSQSM